MSAVHRGSMGRTDGENTRRPLHRVVERAPVPRTPSRIRTGAAAVRGRCPRPLNDGGNDSPVIAGDNQTLVPPAGFEPAPPP